MRQLLCCIGALLLAAASAEDVATEPAAAADADAAEEADPTKQLLEQLTIGMVAEVIDERTFEIRDSAAKTGRKRLHIRLGNVAPPERGAGATDEEHQAGRVAAKAALEKLLAKQMIWWKAGPEEHQPEMPEDKEAAGLIIGDVWLIDGRHVNSLLEKQGHLVKEELYETDLARNILSAEADEQKKTAYKELEEAMKESEKQKRKEAEEQLKAERMKPEPIGVGGWIGLISVGTMVGATFFFGRNTKKGNANKKRGFFGSLWTKLKGA